MVGREFCDGGAGICYFVAGFRPGSFLFFLSTAMKYINPVFWYRTINQFFLEWFLTLQWTHLAKSIPAIALLLCGIVVAAVAYSDGSNIRTRWLTKQLVRANAEGDMATAELVVSRQLKYNPGDEKLMYTLAQTKAEQEEDEDAARLMRQLVRDKRSQRAARWLIANNYVGKTWAELDEQSRKEFGELLKLVVADTPEDVRFQRLLADYYIASQRYNEALPVLEGLSRVEPMRGLQAAALARNLGELDTAERLSKATLEVVEEMLRENRGNLNLALAVAQNQLFLKRYGDAVKTLQAAMGQAKTDQEKLRMRIALGDAIVLHVRALEEAGIDSEFERIRVLRMLQVALQYAPNSPRVLSLVVDQILKTVEDDSEQVATLREALMEGTSTGVAHFIRGTAALVDDDLETATRSLTLAAKQLPRSGAILNNLAVALSLRKEPRLEMALKVSNEAIKQTPNASPHFFETRGQVLYRLQRYEEAIPDLEIALTEPKLAAKAHESLAVCYAKAGDEVLAELHRKAFEDSQAEKKEG